MKKVAAHAIFFMMMIKIATGGTLEAIIKLVERLGGEVVRICCLIELPDLKGRENLKGYEISSCIQFEGE